MQFASDARAAEEANQCGGLSGPLNTEKWEALLAFVDGLGAYGATNLSAGVLTGLGQLNN